MDLEDDTKQIRDEGSEEARRGLRRKKKDSRRRCEGCRASVNLVNSGHRSFQDSCPLFSPPSLPRSSSTESDQLWLSERDLKAAFGCRLNLFGTLAYYEK
ncbi:hypothetical protein HPP92_016915 [Vanilla planifolia]|uniref:Uncharacterized protein n=1 Tax=Vanilla planifolia TaxID=51239 RepID=A0A835URQ6_VANPL|nr:hypothetical protein HPP92_016915 [Vanilla planifolia]